MCAVNLLLAKHLVERAVDRRNVKVLGEPMGAVCLRLNNGNYARRLKARKQLAVKGCDVTCTYDRHAVSFGATRAQDVVLMGGVVQVHNQCAVIGDADGAYMRSSRPSDLEPFHAATGAYRLP
jgi:hypothetical protein